MADSISNSQDIIDSRDVIERIAELTTERDEYVDAREETHAEHVEAYEPYRDSDTIPLAILDRFGTEDEPGAFSRDEVAQEWARENPDDAQELGELESLASEAGGYADDWRYGVAMIRDNYFESYAQELAEDLGAIDKAANWPNNCIDWERAASELQQNYTSVEFAGVTYWVR